MALVTCVRVLFLAFLRGEVCAEDGGEFKRSVE